MASSPQPAREPQVPLVSKDQDVRSWLVRIVAPIIVLALLASSAYLGIMLSRRQALAKSDSAPRAVYPDPSTMGLSGSRVGHDIQITWNPQSPAFSDVKIGILTIKDGDAQREIALTAAELQARTLIYTPNTNRVEASLEAFSPDRKSSRESVLFVLEPRGDLPPGPTETASLLEATSAATLSTASRDTQHRSRMEPASAPPVREFTPPPTPPRATPERVVVLAPPPSLDVAHSAIASAPAVQLPQVSVPRLSEIQQPARAPQPQPQQPERVQPAAQAKPRRPIRHVRAELPPNVISMLADRVQIDVRVRIDASGKVVHAESLASRSVLNQYLATAALSAARLWRFEPRTNSEDTVTLKFIFEPR